MHLKKLIFLPLNKKIIAFAILVVLLLSLSVNGITSRNNYILNEMEVKIAVENWVRYYTADARPDAFIENMESHIVDGEIVAYIAHLNDGGYCLCGANKFVLPVYLYSPFGIYDSDNPGCQYILSKFEKIGKYLQKNLKQYQSNIEEKALFWDDLIKGKIQNLARNKDSSFQTSQMVLPFETQWGQRDPFNRECPRGFGNQRCAAGCVAIAMAQIMKYWEWPLTGVGSHEYNWDGDDAGGTGRKLSADFSDEYDWANMIDDYTSTATTQQVAAVAELCNETGVSVNMDYGTGGSSAKSRKVPNVLESNFRYDSDVYYDGGNFDHNAVKENIQWLRPVYIRGNSTQGNHAWVIYGYDSDRSEYIMNMGWDGDWNNWYVHDGAEGPDPGNIFDSDIDLILDIAPTNKYFVDNTGSGDGTPNNPYGSMTEALDNVPSGKTLILKAGQTYDGFSLIDKPVTIKGYHVILGGPGFEWEDAPYGGLGVSFTVQSFNSSVYFETNVEGLVFLGKSSSGTIEPNTIETIKIRPIGLGPITIKITLNGIENNYTGLLLGFFTLNLKEAE